jgi:hypothetical protein
MDAADPQGDSAADTVRSRHYFAFKRFTGCL